jgi:hypothetical protein
MTRRRRPVERIPGGGERGSHAPPAFVIAEAALAPGTMRSRTSFPALLVGLAVGLFAVSASATPLCDGDDGREGNATREARISAERFASFSLTLERSNALERDLPREMAEAPIAGAIEELIIPCAMVESDLLGPWCVDAAFYLVTTSGTLLCRVSLPAVDIASTSTPDLEERDPAPTPQRTPLPAPAGGLASALKDAAKPLALERVSLLDRTRLPPSPVYAEPPFVPG